jgi:hypothetical protein
LQEAIDIYPSAPVCANKEKCQYAHTLHELESNIQMLQQQSGRTPRPIEVKPMQEALYEKRQQVAAHKAAHSLVRNSPAMPTPSWAPGAAAPLPHPGPQNAQALAPRLETHAKPSQNMLQIQDPPYTVAPFDPTFAPVAYVPHTPQALAIHNASKQQYIDQVHSAQKSPEYHDFNRTEQQLLLRIMHWA